MSTILIIGLGNPGTKYEKTRHNAGFLAIDRLAKKIDATFKEDKARHAEVAEAVFENHKVILAKPQTFMNLSGEAVRALKDRFNVETKDIWVISDDVALPLGTLRIRAGGSAGGHNGLKSIIEHVGDGFPRFKIGVDAQPENVPLEAWVVSRFSDDEMVMLKEVIEQTIHAILDGLEKGLDTKTTKIDKDE
jgi:PTH1 family peptidyl-tRNA hydrolase